MRKFALIVHVISSVGWLGAVAGFLALAIAGLTSSEMPTKTAAALSMSTLTWWVIVPLSFASPLSGLVSSLSTPWGLFRHYWVMIKLLMTVPSTIFLLVHTQPIALLAAIAIQPLRTPAEMAELQLQLAVNAGAAMLVLVVASALSLYKPKGLTQYGTRRLLRAREAEAAADPSSPSLG